MRILILTSVYKDESLGKRDNSTNIVNSFAREWKNQGHDVLVIHNAHSYPKIIHFLPLIIRKKLTSILNFQIPDYKNINEKKYSDYGITVYRIPIKKYIPHHSPSKKKINLQLRKIKKILKDESFNPQVITAHWCSPQLEIIANLKEMFHCPTAIVLHGLDYIENKRYQINNYLKYIDNIGCRSNYQSKSIKEKLNLNEEPFICYSGIPDKYLLQYKLNTNKFNKIKKWKIIYVGRLVSYKNIDITIKALAKIQEIPWELNIVGDGIEKQKLEKLSENLGCKDKVIFWGKISRDEVMNLMDKMHIFTMVSTNEVFGLAYLEAMASSCITIASKNGGIDGIIIDSKNGYLCVQESVEDLFNKFRFIFSQAEDEIKELVKNAYNEVHNYSDSKAAELYLNNIKRSND